MDYLPKVKPFLKWAGGKGQLLSEIEKYYPFDGKKITRYAEPFVGGGAVLFDILNKYDLDEVYISDINNELINTYQIVRDEIERLIDMLSLMQDKFITLDIENRRSYYMKKRARFNELKINGNEDVNIEKAALMIFLNKTCFNGLFRVNKNGLFNVPMGSYKNPLICDEQNLRAVSKKLQNVTIVCGDYRKSADFIDDKTFVYIDPPYRPITDTANFTAYTEELFNDDEHIELARFVDQLKEKGAKVVVSNSDPKNSNANDDFFDKIYARQRIKRVEATRMINCNSEARGKITELLISTFKVRKMAYRDFNDWFNTFRNSIADYNFVDFDKVYKNVNDIKVELNILNTLISSKNIESDFEDLVKKYPEVLKCIPSLLAVRAGEIYAVDKEGAYTYNFKEQNLSVDQYKIFMRKTGLFDLMENHIISNLVDYVTGVEIGLDSTVRKNKADLLMKNLVEDYIVKAGFIKNENYFKEMHIFDIVERWGINLRTTSSQRTIPNNEDFFDKAMAEKTFNFVVMTRDMIYGIDANFFTSKGSKLNGTVQSNKDLAREADEIDGFTFVWITDGKGWTGARGKLEEAFDSIENLYNINDLEKGIIKEIFR